MIFTFVIRTVICVSAWFFFAAVLQFELTWRLVALLVACDAASYVGTALTPITLPRSEGKS